MKTNIFLLIICMLVFFTQSACDQQVKKMKYNPLTPEEQAVILHKATERPFTGEYDTNFEKGTYVCKQCNAPLYRSEDKFDAHCGWPSFDDEIPGAVKRIPDADGQRTEIVCTNCGAHLGHVFIGERLTPKNTRYCVNSISMKFIPSVEKNESKDQIRETAYFASGCFWGTQYHFMKAKGVIATTVGYMGGRTQNPTYKQVCTGETGHVETTQVVFDKTKTSYEDMVKLYFETHDFTQVGGQGPDIGDQYRSVIFYSSEDQRLIAEKYIGILTDKGYKVATILKPAPKFWKAEDYHQEYYEKNHGTPYCHIYRKIF
ncbi:MAG: bifunctional methionine sulfoxide reductase B/A protein [Bacteroidota bacterium]|nr:bifunctional methionine sulfoxide reductase B/A protein [Bacteroidota bacterium]